MELSTVLSLIYLSFCEVYDFISTFVLWQVHDGVVEDVAWHMRHEYLFGSVGDDKLLLLWDLRSSVANKPANSVMAHNSEVNIHIIRAVPNFLAKNRSFIFKKALSINPHNVFIIIWLLFSHNFIFMYYI